MDDNEDLKEVKSETNSVKKSVSEALCKHYIRRCKLVCLTCKEPSNCRLCHDDLSSHKLDRHAVEEVVCSKCDTKQKVSPKCINCDVLFGKYSCLICNMFDDRKKGQFHCDKCGICRIGGVDNYFHCDKCDLCLPISLKDNHKCVEKVSHNDCAICLEDLHTSVIESHIFKCGHIVHTSCFKQMLKHQQYRCPFCLVSAIDMSSEWQRLDGLIAETPMPEEYCGVEKDILCYDCNKKSKTMFHVIGLKCHDCGSYNTTERQ